MIVNTVANIISANLVLALSAQVAALAMAFLTFGRNIGDGRQTRETLTLILLLGLAIWGAEFGVATVLPSWALFHFTDSARHLARPLDVSGEARP